MPAVLTQEEAELRLDLSVKRQARQRHGGGSALRYHDDPVGFATDCVDWRGSGLTDYQAEILRGLLTARRSAVRGPHGLGKTTLAAIAILWFAVTRDAAGEEWKVVTTASAWQQLTHFLWPEIHKWARRLRWEALGREPFSELTELLKLSLSLDHGEAFAVASTIPDRIEGAHADEILYVFDEAKIIPAETFDSAEGALSTGNAYALAVSTPGEPQGRFYDLHARKAGTEDWTVRHVRQAEVLAAGRMQATWAEQRRRQWGETSAVYQNRVLGEFAASDEDGIIPLAWVEAANQRWLDLQETEPVAVEAIGVDVADQGEDATVFALRAGHTILGLDQHHREDTMATAGRVKGLLTAHPGATAIVDVIGIGAGVVARLRELGAAVVGFNAAERAGPMSKRGGRSLGTARDLSGDLGFVNKRARAWWTLRELLDPANGEDVALPPDDRLTGDLTAPHWKVVSGGKIQVESKPDIRKRLGRSTDAGDAVVMSFWQDEGASLLAAWAAGTIDCPRCGLPVTLYGEDDRCGYCGALVEAADDVA